jgi:hypothetical protein
MCPILLIFALWTEPPASEIPRPEHPQPQMQRREWLNLNGVWEFAETDADSDRRFLDSAPYSDRITVPFCRESQLSGLGRRGFIKNVWYRRTFARPADWRAPRTRLHLGACDWQTRVWINGQEIGQHLGGSAAFAFDITPALAPGENVLVIHAQDDTRSGLQALGKQSATEQSEGIFYTRTTGIWQTVWLEGVGESYVARSAVVPDVQHARILLQADLEGAWQGLTLRADASARGVPCGSAGRALDGRSVVMTLDLSEKHLWSVDDPFLYDLNLSIARGDEVIDEVQSYFGLRSVAIEGAAVLINGRAVFQRLVLDQGFYPDGVWTAPSDADLRHDIELSKALGFNGARLHQKVFEPRFLYWADRLGYLVWGEFPSYGANYANRAVELPIAREWVEILQRDRNHPAIIGWCPFNETPPEAGHLQNTLVALTRAIDPTRPVLDTSGWSHSTADPELLDAHDYDQNPVTFRARWQNRCGGFALPARYGTARCDLPYFISEYGGIGWYQDAGGAAWGYGQMPKSLDEFYTRYAGLTDALLDQRTLFGFCYTQLTDVEQERNGLYTFDRQPKFDAERIRAINSRKAAYEKDPPRKSPEPAIGWHMLVGAFPDGAGAHEWRYITDTPPAEWIQPDFDDHTWKPGRGGFGRKGGWENRTRTSWTTSDIWLRQVFPYDGATWDRGALVIHYDNATEVYVNGRKLWQAQGWNDQYAGFDVTSELRAALRPGENLIAIHCHQDEGGQFIDAALLLGSETEPR